jgi:hypothetical protein
MATAAAVLALITGVLGLIGTAYGIYQKIRAGEFGEAAKEAKAGLDTAEKTRDAMVLVINALPSEAPLTRKLKDGIEYVAEKWKVNEGNLEQTVDALQEIAQRVGLGNKKSDQTNLEELAVVAKAVEEARATRYPKLPDIPSPVVAPPILGGLISVMLAALLWTGCFAAAPERMTREVIWPGDPVRGYPAEIVVRWPAGTHRGDVYTTEMSSQTLSVAPLR